MNDLQRLAIVVKSAEPYLKWARDIAGPEAGPIVWDSAEFETVYLVDEPDDIDEIKPEEIIAEYYSEIFDDCLYNWDRKKGVWPQNRTLEMFREWFQVRVIEMVLDLGVTDIEE